MHFLIWFKLEAFLPFFRCLLLCVAVPAKSSSKSGTSRVAYISPFPLFSLMGKIIWRNSCKVIVIKWLAFYYLLPRIPFQNCHRNDIYFIEAHHTSPVTYYFKKKFPPLTKVSTKNLSHQSSVWWKLEKNRMTGLGDIVVLILLLFLLNSDGGKSQKCTFLNISTRCNNFS